MTDASERTQDGDEPRRRADQQGQPGAPHGTELRVGPAGALRQRAQARLDAAAAGAAAHAKPARLVLQSAADRQQEPVDLAFARKLRGLGVRREPSHKQQPEPTERHLAKQRRGGSGGGGRGRSRCRVHRQRQPGARPGAPGPHGRSPQGTQQPRHPPADLRLRPTEHPDRTPATSQVEHPTLQTEKLRCHQHRR